MRLAVPLLGFAVLVLAAYAPHPEAAAPGPAARDSTEWVNLQVLPDTLPRDSLIQIMRGFSLSLGVRCEHCHAPGAEGLDFPSDANPHKDVARDMMRMTWALNAETLPAIEGLHGEGRLVTCYTCHRGAARPATEVPEPGAPPPPADDGHDHGDHDHGDG